MFTGHLFVCVTLLRMQLPINVHQLRQMLTLEFGHGIGAVNLNCAL